MMGCVQRPDTSTCFGNLMKTSTESVGTNYWSQTTSDLVQWVNISTNRATSDFLESSDPGGRDFDYRFYRALPQP